jgi:hypothetical protein
MIGKSLDADTSGLFSAATRCTVRSLVLVSFAAASDRCHNPVPRLRILALIVLLVSGKAGE